MNRVSVNECPQRGGEMIAPEWSEHLSDHCTRNGSACEVFDTLSTVTTPEQVNLVKHYNECVAKAALNLHELAENMKAYAETQLDLRDKPTPFARNDPEFDLSQIHCAYQIGRTIDPVDRRQR